MRSRKEVDRSGQESPLHPGTLFLSARLLGTTAAGVLACCLVARADATAAFDPHSTAATPCGVGTPEPGHLMPELRPSRGLVTLTVRQDSNRLCYVARGSADAPVVRIRQGENLAITLENEISDPSAIESVTAAGKLKVGNDPVPRVPGFYPVSPGMRHPANGATNLHVHGFAVPPVAPQDDVLTVCTDPARGPANCGRRAYTYRYKVPRTMPEGLYWYHPHMHGEVQAQMLMGLTGAIVVEGPETDARRRAGIDERVLIVRQVQDQDSGRTPTASMIAALPEGPNAPSSAADIPDTEIDTAHELLCTSNSAINQISLNGTPVPLGDAPDADLANFAVPQGQQQFWRILNAATDAFLNLAIVNESGQPLPMEVVARDGSPLTDDIGKRLHPGPTLESQPVPPAGRIEILVGAPPAGQKAYLITRAVDTGCAGDRLPQRRLAVIQTVNPRPGSMRAARGQHSSDAPSRLARLPAHPDFFSGVLARKTDRERVIALAEYPRPGTSDQIDFYIFERKPGAALMPYMMGDPPAITVHAGTTEEWVIENWTNELHTFHIHQFHFRVLEVDGSPLAVPPLLDVVEVPYATATGYHSKEGPVRPGRVRVKMTFPASLAGDVPFHCHLVDHEDNGMMAVLRVLPASRH